MKLWNIILISIIGIIALLGIYYYFKPTGKVKIDDELSDEEKYQLDQVVHFVKESFNNVLRNNLHELHLSKEEHEKRSKNKSELKGALKLCGYGDKDAKAYIKDYIKNILINDYKINEDNVELIIPYGETSQLTAKEKFDIILYLFKQKHGKNAIKELFKKYQLDRLKGSDTFLDEYYIEHDEINQIYAKEKTLLGYEDKVNILVQRVYEVYKGFSVIDEIRDMNIDGVSAGVSGVTQSMFESLEIKKDIPMNYESIWIFYQGKSIHLRFLGFESENDLKRVCKNIYKYNAIGQLSESTGYKVNDMKDGSRVVVVRPPFSDSWAFLVRKLDNLESKAIEDLMTHEGNEIPINILKYILKANKTMGITGVQGAGKTTLLMSMIRFVDKRYNLRTQELMFELQLRKLYPFRNVLAFRQTSDVTGQDGLNLQKKTDGSVNILGEIAAEETANWMIQTSQSASLYSLFTHHAIHTKALVEWFRNAILKCGGFSNEFIAEQQVVNALNFHTHLNKTKEGERYAEYITEIIPFSHEYSRKYRGQEGLEGKLEKIMDTIVEYFEATTNRKTFEERRIVEWKDGRYYLVNNFSDKTIQDLKRNISKKEFEEFEAFIQEGMNKDVF